MNPSHTAVGSEHLGVEGLTRLRVQPPRGTPRDTQGGTGKMDSKIITIYGNNYYRNKCFLK
jgi:hypothetical protein